MATGKKTGGRVAGVPNKKTLARRAVVDAITSEQGREAIRQELATLAKPPVGTKRAVDVLREMMMLSGSLVALYQPKKDATGKVVIEHEDRLQTYLNFTIKAAGDLARFESPTFKAVAVSSVPETPNPGDTAKVVKSLDKRSPAEVVAIYTRIVQHAKAG